MNEYHQHFPISEPVEDYEDRNRLYAMSVLPRAEYSASLTRIIARLFSVDPGVIQVTSSSEKGQ